MYTRSIPEGTGSSGYLFHEIPYLTWRKGGSLSFCHLAQIVNGIGEVEKSISYRNSNAGKKEGRWAGGEEGRRAIPQPF